MGMKSRETGRKGELNAGDGKRKAEDELQERDREARRMRSTAMPPTVRDDINLASMLIETINTRVVDHHRLRNL